MSNLYIRICSLSVAILASALLAPPAHGASCDGFVDVDSSATYCAAVTFVKARSITIGCADATHYCPSDYVTRAQMALFLQRSALADPSNSLNGLYSNIGGGQQNTAGSTQTAYVSVGGGYSNNATAELSVISGGEYNTASGDGFSAVGGGYANSATGKASTVPGGHVNTASGDYSFAAGIYANADQTACAVFALWSSDTSMTCLGSTNVFRIAADHGFSVDYQAPRSGGGGTRYVAIGDLLSGQTIGTWTGAFLSDGGTWTNASDRAAKEDFEAIDSADVLARVAAMPITRWKYKRDPAVTHLGPVAQDFHAAFGLGTNDVSISTVDEEGVALAAIQGLNAKLEETVAQQAAELAAFKAVIATMQEQLAALGKKQR